MAKHKVKANFTHKGKQYKPGDDFESDDQHEAQTLASQGHIEPQPHSGGQSQGQGAQPGGSKGQQTGEDPSKSGH